MFKSQTCLRQIFTDKKMGNGSENLSWNLDYDALLHQDVSLYCMWTPKNKVEDQPIGGKYHYWCFHCAIQRIDTIFADVKF